MRWDRTQVRWGLESVAVIVVLAGADLALGPRVSFSGTLVIGPFIAAAVLDPLPTAGVAALALVAGAVISLVEHPPLVEGGIRLVAVIGGSLLAVWLASLRVKREQELAAVSRVAEVAQRCILSAVPSTVGEVAFASRYLSATREAAIGGDLYEVVECEGLVRAVVGDVRGKGLDAVRLAALVLGSFREAAQSLMPLQDVALLMDRRLVRHLDAEDFVTAVLVEFRADGTVVLVNCGHHPPLCIRAHGIELLTAPSATTPLGLDPCPVPQTTVLAPGDRVLLYTDGLVEARSTSGRMLALDHLAGTLRRPDLDDALGELVRMVQTLVRGPVADDLALLLAEYRGRGSTQEVPDPVREAVARR